MRSARSSPPNSVARSARFGHTSCWTAGSHTCRQWFPAAPAGVVNVTACSTGPTCASESASICIDLTWSMNATMSSPAEPSAANWNNRIATSSRSLAARPATSLRRAARCQTPATPVAFQASANVYCASRLGSRSMPSATRPTISQSLRNATAWGSRPKIAPRESNTGVAGALGLSNASIRYIALWPNGSSSSAVSPVSTPSSTLTAAARRAACRCSFTASRYRSHDSISAARCRCPSAPTASALSWTTAASDSSADIADSTGANRAGAPSADCVPAATNGQAISVATRART